MHCVVTGVAGFVGSSLCDRLLADGHTVVGIDCFTPYYARELKERNIVKAKTHKNFRFVEQNLNQADLASLLSGAAVVFHQAAQAGVRASWGAEFSGYCDHNILATQKLLEACKDHQTIKKVVYASSSSVYGNAECYPTTERILPRPVSPYGVTKLAAENLATLYAIESRVPTVSLRYFTVFGPRQRPDMAFHRIARAALRGEEFVLFGDGEQSRDFTFISDIVEANLAAGQRGSPGDIFNIGGGTQATMNQVIEIFRTHVSSLKVRKVERQLGDARHTSADTSEAQTKLGFRPAVSLAEGIRRELEWMESLLSS